MTIHSIETTPSAVKSPEQRETYPEKIARIALTAMRSLGEGYEGRTITLLSAQKDLAAEALLILECSGIVGRAYADDPALVHFDYLVPVASEATESKVTIVPFVVKSQHPEETCDPLVA